MESLVCKRLKKRRVSRISHGDILLKKGKKSLGSDDSVIISWLPLDFVYSNII